MKPFTIATLILVCLSRVCLSEAAQADESAQQVLLRARTASGGAAWDRVSVIEAVGEQRAAGLNGKWQGTDDLRTGRTARKADFGIYRIADGFDGKDRWKQDRSGGVHCLNSTFAIQATATDAWLARRGWLRSAADGAKLGTVQTRTDAGRTYSVIEATPPNGQSVELWFGPDGMLGRTVRLMPIDIVTTTYSDYRDVNGLKLPFSILIDYDTPGQEESIKIRSYQLGETAVAQAFARPAPPRDAVVPANGTTVPLEIDGHIVVEARLNGRDVMSFILDTGGHDILTPAAAEQLGLKPVGDGASGGAGEGTLKEQSVRVDRVEIGSATMTDQHFYVLPLQYSTVDRGSRAPLAGIIGLELFERFVVRLDYRAKTLTIKPFEGYRYQGKGVPVRMTFADDMPLVSAALDGRTGDFALDTGNSGSLVVQHIWAKKQGIAESMKRGIAMNSYGAGGQSSNWASRAKRYEMAGTTIQNVIVRYAEDKRGAFSSRTEAGNIGTDILGHFTLEFDYSSNTLWVEPVPGFVPMPFSRSGFQAIKESPKAFTVVRVRPDTPAAVAGMKAADEILAVDGKPAPQMSGRDLLHKMTQAPGTAVKLMIRRDGKELPVTITLRELLPVGG